MIARHLGAAVLVAAATASVGLAQLDAPSRLYDIPRLDNIVIDGKADDWGDRGYIIDDIRKLNSPGRGVDVDARIGWNDKGLLLFLNLADSRWVEADKVEELWRGDSVEIAMTPRKADPNMVQCLIATGMDTNHPALRKWTYDYRKDEDLLKTPVGTAGVAVVKDADGRRCALEILFPYEGLGIEPRVGRELAFQIVINNKGGQNVWFQGVKLWRNPHHVQRIRLAEKAGPRDIFQVTNFKQIKNSLVMELGITKRGTGYPADNNIAVLGDGVVITNIVYSGGRYTLRLAPPPFGKPYHKLVFAVAGEDVGEYEINTDDLYLSELKKIPLAFESAVFQGKTFPACDFSDPARVRALIGDYTVTRAFFDAQKNEVKEAGQPGRYGAVVAVKSGATEKKQYVTLYALASSAAGADASAAGYSALTGIREDLVKANEAAIAEALQKKDAVAAVRLAALRDRALGIDKDSWSNDPAVRDNRWWLRLRHQMGEDIRLLSPHVFAVNTPPGYEENPDRKYGLFYYCPGRGFDCDETWEGIRVHSAHGLFKAGKNRVAAPFLSCMAHSFDGYKPSEIAQIMEIIEVLYRMDPRRVCIAGHSGGAEHARMFSNSYPDRLAAVILMHHGPWSGKNLTGQGRPTLTSSPDQAPGYFDVDRHYADLDKPGMNAYFDTFSKRTYDWLESLTRKLPEDKE